MIYFSYWLNNNVYETYKFVQLSKIAIHRISLITTLKIQLLHALPKEIKLTNQTVLDRSSASFKSHTATATQNGSRIILSNINEQK